MKTLRFLVPALALAVTLPVSAAFQSVQLAPDNVMPQYPGVLHLRGITRGYAVMAVSIDEQGKLKDSLVLAYTQEPLVRASLAALREWRFIPAQLDGVPVPVQTELRFDYTLSGAVITSNAVNHFFYDNFENAGDNAPMYQPARADQLDHPVVKISGDAPQYAREAASAGVNGKVTVRFYIDEKGEVRLPSVVIGADPYLMEQAVAAVKSWKFEPPTSRGRPVLVAASQEFDFGGR